MLIIIAVSFSVLISLYFLYFYYNSMVTKENVDRSGVFYIIHFYFANDFINNFPFIYFPDFRRTLHYLIQGVLLCEPCVSRFIAPEPNFLLN